ncbi:hypothetical protein QYE76_002820 [Lolium multiflorum]|uniref:Retrotransposon gag domain-containing protein n=1 Tax=Lolium multiflorum TaxID=4521 RepID=A0AAD8RN53_LOLMU|nr:hypothetical protein QYE76_002820 [Lolium multiflorum]
MSRVSLQDSINPKPQSEGTAEEYLDNWRRLRNLSAEDPTSADPVMSSTPSSPSSPRLGSPIRFGSYEFTPHSDSSRSTFSDLQGNMEMTFGSIHYNVNAEGVLRLLGPHTPGKSDSGNARLRLYLKDSAQAWLRGLSKGSIKSWDDLVDAFIANFQATYNRPVGIEELRHCQQKQKESMRAYIGRFTKLLNAAKDVSVNIGIDTFSDGIRRETYIEELGCKKPKTITKLMEIANSWADGEDNVRKPRQRSDDEDDDQPKHDSGGRRDRRHAALIVEAQIGGFKMSKVFMDGGSVLNLIFVDTIRSMGITMRMLEETDTCFHGILPTSPAYSLGKVYLNVVFGKPDNFRKENIEFEVVNWESQNHAILRRSAYANFMVVPHYAYLKLKMPGNNGTNITVYGSFSRSDNCDRDFQRIAAKFGVKQEIIDLPSKSSAHDNKEDERGRKTEKKQADLALEVLTIKAWQLMAQQS